MQNLGSGSNRPPLKAMDFCFDSAVLINRGGKPMGILNCSYKRKLFSTAMLVNRQGIHQIFGGLENPRWLVPIGRRGSVGLFEK